MALSWYHMCKVASASLPDHTRCHLSQRLALTLPAMAVSHAHAFARCHLAVSFTAEPTPRVWHWALFPVGGAVGSSNRVEQGFDFMSVNHNHDLTLNGDLRQLSRSHGASVPPLESGADQTNCEGVEEYHVSVSGYPRLYSGGHGR